MGKEELNSLMGCAKAGGGEKSHLREHRGAPGGAGLAGGEIPAQVPASAFCRTL